MLSAEDNELLTRTGPGTPMGDFFRRFWMPVLLSQELPERDGPPVRVKVMGEDLVAFRNSDGRVGLLGPRRCAWALPRAHDARGPIDREMLAR
jgi:phthalate 4,5-dioxygenase